MVGGSLAVTLVYGVFFAFGVFFTPLRSEFGWSNAETSAAFSVHAGAYVASAMLMGKLTDAYGPKLPLGVGGLLMGLGLVLSSLTANLLQFYFFYGLVTSLGVGAVFIPTHSTVVRWFVKRRGAALSVVTVGAGLGAILIPPAVERLIALYGWREAFVVCGVLVWSLMLVGIVLIKNPSREALEAHGELSEEAGNIREASPPESLSLGAALRTKAFWLILSTYLLFFTSTFIPLVHVVPFAIASGIQPLTAAGALSVFGVSSIFGRLTIGPLSDRIGRVRALVICLALLTGSIISLVGVKNAFALYLSAAVFGYAFGGFIPQMPAIIGDFFGSKSIGVVYGVFEGLAYGIGIGIGPVLGGYLIDVTGGYREAFLAGGLITFSALLSIALTRPPRKHRPPTGSG
ncbi:MFS transporter [Candidatus Hecatella orcuttiae]|uniref:MFS transporter n=1 Tax=Candidatus Hecatella orcuttiae TaxID=1935119 RepID=UPI002867C635|nr:MFS transporter [Candidatus Hecatella orcuttiae]